jgi:diamine N-acetyltransferase
MAPSTGVYPVTLRPSQSRDLPFVIAAERHANNLIFVGQWSPEEHQAAIDAADEAHLIVERSEDSVPVGYTILQGLTDNNHSILLRRIVIAEKGKGYGRAALQQLKTLVFEAYKAHRFWLDVKEFNPRARKLYESEGFVLEGSLREALKTEDGYHSMYVMSLLVSEFEAAQARRPV